MCWRWWWWRCRCRFVILTVLIEKRAEVEARGKRGWCQPGKFESRESRAERRQVIMQDFARHLPMRALSPVPSSPTPTTIPVLGRIDRGITTTIPRTKQPNLQPAHPSPNPSPHPPALAPRRQPMPSQRHDPHDTDRPQTERRECRRRRCGFEGDAQGDEGGVRGEEGEGVPVGRGGRGGDC